jgi:hypothetical protein
MFSRKDTHPELTYFPGPEVASRMSNLSRYLKRLPRSVDREVAAFNLNMMHLQMQKLLFQESIGGNSQCLQAAGGPYYSATASGYFYPENHKIAVFGNVQHVPHHMRIPQGQFLLRVALDNHLKQDGTLNESSRGFFLISDAYYGNTGAHIPVIQTAIEQVQNSDALIGAAAIYNAIHA